MAAAIPSPKPPSRLPLISLPTCASTGHSTCRLGMAIDECDTLHDRILWLVRVRWLVILACSLAIGLGFLIFPTDAPWRQLFIVVLALLALNLLWLRRSKNQGTTVCSGALRFALYQILGDFSLLAVAVHLTGGIVGPLAPLFVLHCVFSSVVLPRRRTVVIIILAFLFMILARSLRLVGQSISPWHFSNPSYSPSWVPDTIAFGFLACAVGGATLIGLQLSAQLRQRHRRIAALAQELEAKNRELLLIDQHRVRLLGAASHDLRSPLAAIESRLDLLLNGYLGDLEDPQRDHLAKMKSRLKSLRLFINDLLDFTAISSKTAAPAEHRPLELVAQIRDVIAELKPLATDAQLVINESLPEAPVWVSAPPSRLAAVWTNLLSNAIKYGADGHTIEVSLSTHNAMAQIDIADHGPGISKNDQAQLFTDFFRTSSARTSKVSGSGLGLAIVKRVVESAKGSVELKSEVGVGTCLTVRLPLCPAPES